MNATGGSRQPSNLSGCGPMTAKDVNQWLRSLYAVREPSVDRIIVGNPATEVRGIASVWMPNWAALKTALARGCNVVVAHEPTFYSHHDLDGFEEAVRNFAPLALRTVTTTRDAKRRWIEENGMVVIRCHDVLDAMPHGIVDSFAEALGFPAQPELAPGYFRVVDVGAPIKAIDLARRLATVFATANQPAFPFYGDPDRLVRKLGLGTGYSCAPWDLVQRGADMAVTIDDRIKTWTEPEWANDSGYPLVVVHHGVTEEWGMHTLAGGLRREFPQVRVELIRQGCTARWVTAS